MSQSSQGASTSTVNLSPPLTILQSFFSLLTDAPGAGLNELVKLAQQSFTLLYPTNQTSYKAEAWADALTAMVGFVASVGAGDLDAGAQQSLTSLVELVSKSTVTSLSGSQNRRKVSDISGVTDNRLPKRRSLPSMLYRTVSAPIHTFQHRYKQRSPPSTFRCLFSNRIHQRRLILSSLLSLRARCCSPSFSKRTSPPFNPVDTLSSLHQRLPSYRLMFTSQGRFVPQPRPL